jgi:hypothetical protein
MNLRSTISRIVLALLVLSAPSLWAQDGLRGAMSRLDAGTELLRDPLGQRLVAADFDQDQKPDGAVLLGGVHREGEQAFRVELHVTAGQNQELTFASSETALSLSVLDVNHDGTPDIVVEQAFTHKRVEIWLNDGHGVFRVAKSEDYPVGTQSPLSWNVHVPPEESLFPYLPSRSGHESLIPLSHPVPGFRLSSGRVLWPQVLLIISELRAPNPSRGPPFLSYL